MWWWLFKIDIETCRHCGGAVKVIACIEDPVVIKHILAHLERRAEQLLPMTPTARGAAAQHCAVPNGLGLRHPANENRPPGC